jgi:cobalt-zinc-cadmium efflux system protein
MANLDHSHGGQVHRHAANEWRLGIAAALTGTFMLVEAAGGLLAGSLALLADAGHMLADFAALALAWFAFRLSRRPADQDRTYGFERMQVLVAFGNGLALFAIAAWIVVEAVHRLLAPIEVVSGIMLVVAVAGLALNAGMFFVLQGADRDNLNIRGAMVHVIGDLLGSAGVVAAALLILATGWMPADALISVLVAVIILRSAWRVIVDSAHVLLEGVPLGFSVRDVEHDLEKTIDAVEDIHHVHAWSITDERPMVTLHARLRAGSNVNAAVLAIKMRLADRFGIPHATIETEIGECADAQLDFDTDRTLGGPRPRDHDQDHAGQHDHQPPARRRASAH